MLPLLMQLHWKQAPLDSNVIVVPYYSFFALFCKGFLSCHKSALRATYDFTLALPTENAVATIKPTEMASIKNEPMQDAVVDVQPTDEPQIVEGWINGSGFSHEDLLDVRTTTDNAIGNALIKSFVVFDDQGLVSKEPAFIMTNLNS